jgi:HD superfamily phosphohydrolase
MEITDRLYGAFEITEPVLQELLGSASIVRLQHLGQYGLPASLYPEFPWVSRYEHSVGVMLLLRKLGASVTEQAAGLLHDVSHTAFSHVMDWVMERPDQDFQDNRHRAVLERAEIPEILARYNIALDAVAEYYDHRLLEQPAPALCADRVDYALREFKDWAAPGSVEHCVQSLTVYKGKIAFANKEAASAFAMGYSRCEREHWGGASSMLRYELLATAIKRGFALGVLTEEIMDTDDETVLALLRKSNDPVITTSLQRLAQPLEASALEQARKTLHVKKKFRYIDPVIVAVGPLSQAQPAYGDWLQLELQKRASI